MKPTFLSRRVRLFGNVALVILCAVFFVVPFGIRGARMAIEGMKNDVKDWLPKDFPETTELEWFRDHFLGESFILVTWPHCTEADESFGQLVRQLEAESVLHEPSDDGDELAREKSIARQRADELGLQIFAVEEADPNDPDKKILRQEFFTNWGDRNEKWLRGERGLWYYITPDGDLYEWSGSDDLLGHVRLGFNRLTHGRIVAYGKHVASFGKQFATDGKPSPFYVNPRLLQARLFKSITTGPEVLDKLAGDDGSLKRRGGSTDAISSETARREAYRRLSGVLFAPQPPDGFDWTADGFMKSLQPEYAASLPADWQQTFEELVAKNATEEFRDGREALRAASHGEQTEQWFELFEQLGVKPPAWQTCVLITLSDVGRRDLKRVVGRPIMGRAPGRIQVLAQNSGINPSELKLGGPPIDNVAIDEEGTVTLARLATYSAIIGLTLALFCFRSIKVTLMVFFVGGVAAAASLGIVWWGGSSVDAILMTMPSLVYVLGLSGAVHIVNYYRDAAQEHGLKGASETALRHGWFPCTLAAFTTSLGLISLYVSNLTPIKKFGLFSAIGTMATVILLFTYLPSALHIWPPGYHKKRKQQREKPSLWQRFTTSFWERVGGWVVRRHWWVTGTCLIVLVVFALGLRKINTTVQLLKLFDPGSKIISDYQWLEANLGKLVPMELVACVDKDMQYVRPATQGEEAAPRDAQDILKYSFLERAEIVARVQSRVEQEFGDDGQRILGRGMSAATFMPELPGPQGSSAWYDERRLFSSLLERSRDELYESDYLRVDQGNQRELWRVSLRLGALNDVDYGEFVGDLKMVVEPILSAYRIRDKAFRAVVEQRRSLSGTSILVLGADPRSLADDAAPPAGPESDDDSTPPAGNRRSKSIDQTRIFVQTLDELLRNKGYQRDRDAKQRLAWHDPQRNPLDEIEPEKWAALINQFDAVVFLGDDPAYDMDFIRQNLPAGGVLIDSRDYRFDPSSQGTLSAAQRKTAGDPDANVTVVYTGIVPIVYKSQRALLSSLVQSIGLAFVMIAAVMMILLRDWRRPIGPRNTLNVSAGLVSMLPNVFPVVLIFGLMGHFGMLVDIGSMMTASVAMGVAVDDTIHFLTWFRAGLREGLTRRQAIHKAYSRCASAMIQTTLIGGLGLAVFAFSTFTPTQTFGTLMLTLLCAALVGDLVFLPALLAGPLGRFFEVSPIKTGKQRDSSETIETAEDGGRAETPHSARKSQDEKTPAMLRHDRGHSRLGNSTG